MLSKSHQIVIIGGGTAGITVAASLRRRKGGRNLDIAIIEPSNDHYYQPAFTLVGAGCYPLAKTRRDTAALIPGGVSWIQARASGIDPQNNTVHLESSDSITYEHLVICTGLELNWDKITGAKEALDKQGVCSNYSPHHAEYTWNAIQKLKAGDTALFTQPPLPFKCPGAPQKIAYLAADDLKRRGLLEQCEVHFLTHGPGMFGVPFFAKELRKVADRYGIKVHFQHNLIAVDGGNKIATFEVVGGDQQGEKTEISFDLLHLTPPQSPPEFIRSSALANDAGYIDVDQNTLQHTQYSNVFSLGDVCSTPNSKTAAAVRKQAPVVVNNLISLIQGGELDDGYDGYGSCPLTTAYGKVLMAEFTYGGKVTPTFPLDPRKERWINWWMKVTALPIFYWHYMLKGREWFFKHNTNYVEPDA